MRTNIEQQAGLVSYQENVNFEEFKGKFEVFCSVSSVKTFLYLEKTDVKELDW